MAVLMGLTGVIFILFPPRRALTLFPTTVMIGLLLIALLAFLPAGWSTAPAWRVNLTTLGAVLPATRTAQPWITFQWTALLFLILAWSYYLLASDWTRGERDRALATFGIGVLILGGLLVFAHLTRWRIPFWPDVPEFGFFPNRNQTSNVFGLAGIMIYALGLDRLQQHRPTWWLWLCSLSLICSALILNYSRAGIVLFFGGCLVWHIWWLFQAKDRRGPLFALIGIALLFGLLILNGGKTLERFQTQSPNVLSSEHGRVEIFRDALHLSEQAPLLGVGLGNFRPLFSAARLYSASTSEAVHPESDWLWGAVDLGWIAPVLVLLMVFWWLGRCFPFVLGTGRFLRMAAMICGIAFLVHGCFDVSAHRLGTLWPALFLASIALYPERDAQTSGAVTVLFRGFGVMFVALSICWMASIAGSNTMPTSATATRLEGKTQQAVAQGDYQRGLALADEGLRIAALDWSLYYHRGLCEVALYRPRPEAERDFAIARHLFPLWPDLYFKEGMVWLDFDEPDLAFDIWKEGMVNLGASARDLYSSIFPHVHDDADLRERWRQLAGDNPACVLSFLFNATPTEFALETDRLLAADPDLKHFSPSELRALFQAWYQSGDKLSLVEAAASHADWEEIAWRELSSSYASLQDYRRAYETAARHTPSAKLPDSAGTTVDSLVQRFREGTDPARDGLALASAQWRSGDIEAALETAAIALSSPRPPPELYYLTAQLWAAKAEWAKAWQALAKYDKLDPN